MFGNIEAHKLESISSQSMCQLDDVGDESGISISPDCYVIKPKLISTCHRQLSSFNSARCKKQFDEAVHSGCQEINKWVVDDAESKSDMIINDLQKATLDYESFRSLKSHSLHGVQKKILQNQLLPEESKEVDRHNPSMLSLSRIINSKLQLKEDIKELIKRNKDLQNMNSLSDERKSHLVVIHISSRSRRSSNSP